MQEKVNHCKTYKSTDWKYSSPNPIILLGELNKWSLD